MATTKTVNRISQNGSVKKSEVAKPKTKEIQLAPLEIAIARIKIVGLSDLIVKRLSEKTQEALVNKQSKQSPKAKEARDPHQDYLDSLYLLPGSKPAGEKGAKYGFPASGLKGAVSTAAGRFLRDGQKLNGAIVDGALFVLPSEPKCNLIRIIHSSSDPYMRSDPGRNPNSQGKGAIVIHRGAFAQWSMEFNIRYNAGVLSIEQVATLFMWAGFSVGIGEWRPEKGGTYGQFEVSTK